MNSVKKFVRYACLALAGLALSSCIREEDLVCGRYVTFVFDYNLQEVDAFHKHASKIDLYLFDSNDDYQGSVCEEIPDGNLPEKFTVQLPNGYDNATQFVAWAGVYADDCTASDLIPNRSTLSDLCVALNECDGNISSKKYRSMLHGYLQQIPTRATAYDTETVTIRMKNNTNAIRIVMRAKNQDFTVPASQFDFRFVTENGGYDYRNEKHNDLTWTYTPFYQENEDSQGAVVAEISTLRLREDQENRLTIKQNGSSAPIIDEDLNSLFRLMQLQELKQKYTFQEYLDRKDEYSLLVLLERIPTPEGYQYLASEIRINDWTERPQPVE